MQSLILECAVRAILMAVCVGVVLCVLRVKAARVRHAVWASVVVLMLALPVWTAWGPRSTVRVLKPSTADTFSAPAPPRSFRVTIPQAPVRSPAWTWQRCFGGIYLLGLCALLARLAIGTVRAHMLFRSAAKREGRLTSDSCAAPITVGWLSPAIVLPEHWRQWPDAQLNAVLTHEDEHARWRDPLVQWMALLNRAVFWFHPLAWWLERRLSALAEEACDAAVLARGCDPFEYSEYLLEIARAMQQAGTRMKALGMAMPGPFLPQRIRRILEGRPAQRISRLRMICVATACAVVSTVFLAGAINRAQAQPSPARPSPSAAAPTPQEGGSISGTVEDPSGSRVPNCHIILRGQDGANEETVVSDAAGFYRFASISPGHYSLEFQMPGFAKRTRQTEIEAGKPVRIDAQLEIGQSFSTVAVTGQKPAPAPAASQFAAPQPGAISVGGRVEHTVLLRHTQPVYPRELLQQGIEATVRLAAVISPDGVPVNLHVLNTDEVDSRFTQAALDAVSQWRYQPARLNGHPVSTTTQIDVNFELGK